MLKAFLYGLWWLMLLSCYESRSLLNKSSDSTKIAKSFPKAVPKKSTKKKTKSCSILDRSSCPKDSEFCELPQGSCQKPSQQGLCQKKSVFCPMLYKPVCGCDGKTYSNNCLRQSAGVSEKHDGVCSL